MFYGAIAEVVEIKDMFKAVPPKAVFITGTDTEVGKTFCSVALLNTWAAQGLQVAGYKPVASGTNTAGYNDDVLALQAASVVRRTYSEHNTYTYVEATAPHLAAQDMGMVIDTNPMSQQLKLWQQQTDLVLIEGAGGWCTPLSMNVNFADWVMAEQLPVILVVGIKLGAINHAILTAQSIMAMGLPLLGWVANCPTPQAHRKDDYIATLSARLPAPLLGTLPYIPANSTVHGADYLSLSCLQWPPPMGSW